MRDARFAAIITTVLVCVLAAILPPIGRFYVTATALVLGPSFLLAYYWAETPYRWGYLLGICVLAALLGYLDYPRDL